MRYQNYHAWLWRKRLGSALRTSLACIIVGCTTLYGPVPLRRLLTYPAFSYVTTILVVSEATLGDTLRSSWHVLYATVQVVIPSMLSLWLIGPARFKNELVAAVAVAINAFLVALPESTHLMSKRIAFGQIVIVYVGTVVHGSQTGVFMHPIHVASSTAVGALASVLAMLFPYPRLAYCELRKTCRLYAENASERMTLMVEAISAQDQTAARELICQEKALSKSGARLLQDIKNNLGGMKWERPQLKFLKANDIDLVKKLQEMELPLRGMEISLSFCPSIPVQMMDDGLKHVLHVSKVQAGLKLEQAKCSAPFDGTTAPEGKGETLDRPIWTTKTTSTTQEDLSAMFLLYCMALLTDGPPVSQDLPNNLNEDSEESKEILYNFRKAWSNLNIRARSQKFSFALKCSLSLGLAVFFGLLYQKENGYWSGLTIAISFVTGRQATFNVANARAQGTVMGSIYGILCLFVFQRFLELRLLALLPWIIISSFLIHSRIYGQAGGFSAAIGALLIVGRKNYGAPSEFAIARIIEASIGLLCFILVEILLNPVRAATLAKTELSQSIGALGDCIRNITLCSQQKNMPPLSDKQHQLTHHVNELEKFIQEAQLEPNFWFLPFHGACYTKLLESLSAMVNLLLFISYQIEFLTEASQNFEGPLRELLQHMNDDLERFTKKVGSSLKSLQEATSASFQVFEEASQRDNTSHDIELGKSSNRNAFKRLTTENREVQNILSSFLQHLDEFDRICIEEGKEPKSQMVLCSTGLGFCIQNVARETMEIENQVKELVQWENPSSQRNLYKILCKIIWMHT
ncbi:hypothetical protein FEM48_Zijuj11G0090700 [Ziziphus jujuba var. spinosa]|uniref:p-hydroxybenzoic acid efflux pump subunit AaeB n=1 Tax=Ziziphus jujuba var. spinosa TaxID=714518 RepID=A0A978UI17_ZIZJJ|nr:hypothetical protein FEM48_Zijuj11G0090700 [Ziziphus jujuba var. spinosa]